MRRLITAGILSLTAVLAATPALAQGPGPGGLPGGMRPPVDQAVMKEVQEADQKFWTDSLESRKQIRLKEAQIQVLFLKAGTTPEELLAANRELQQLIDRMNDKELLYRFELSRKYPQLELFPGPGPQLGPEGMGRPGPCRPAPQMGQGPQGQRPGKGGPPPKMECDRDQENGRPEMSDQDRSGMEKSSREAAQLHRDIRLKMAELRALLLTPGTTTQALLAKNKEVQELKNKLDEGRLLRRFEMTKRHLESALEREGDTKP